MKNIFDAYAQGEMNGRTFVKVFKDAKVLDKKLQTTSLDIIFNKIKTKGKLKITYSQFVEGVNEAAKEKECEASALCKKICSMKGP